ncbi:MAG: PIN domain-containing protein [Chitinophagaceae bacterium]
MTREKYNIAKDFLSFFNVAGLTPSVKEASIIIGRQYKIKLPDAIIAATAISLGIPLLTTDKGFSPVEALDLIIIEI